MFLACVSASWILADISGDTSLLCPPTPSAATTSSRFPPLPPQSPPLDELGNRPRTVHTCHWQRQKSD